MKKILGLAVAVAFAFTATAVFAADQNTAANAVKAPTAEKATVTATEKVTAKKDEVKVTEKTAGKKEEVKVTEKVTSTGKIEEKVVAKTVIDPKVDCLKKNPGKTEKDAEVVKCVADAKANVTKPEAAKATETAKATTATEKKVTEATKTTTTTTPVKK